MADITFLQGSVGASTANDGDSRAVQLSRNLGLRTVDNQAAFQAAVERGNAYCVANQAGVTSQAGLSLTTPVMTIANPVNSGVNGVLWFAGATFSVAFATAGAVFLALGDYSTTAVTGTPTTTHRNLKTGAGTGNKIKSFLAGTLPAAPVGVALLGVGLTGVITTTPHLQSLGRWFNGGLILQPGCNLSIQTGVASGASGTFCEFVWEEVAI